MKIIIVIFSLFFIAVVGVSLFVKKSRYKNSTRERLQDTIELKKSDNIHEVIAEDDYRDLSTATELLLKNSLGKELFFKRPNVGETPKKKYREVAFSNVNNVSGKLVNASMPFIQQSFTINQLAQAAPNGLFTTSVSPEKLSKFADGSYSTMVRNAAKKLVGHQGFVEVTDVIKANPMVAISASMQAMALVSGQYYLHQINAQMESISERIDELINYHHDEKIGLLLTVKDRLLKIASKQNADDHDIGEIRTLLKDAKNVYEEYRVRLLRQLEELEDFKSKAFFEKDKLSALEEKIQDINFTMKIVYEADQLSIQAELSEIAIRMKLGEKNLVIQELTEQMKEHYDTSFYLTVDKFIKEKYRPIVRERYRLLGKKYLLKHPERLKQINNSVSLSEMNLVDSRVGDLTQRLLLEKNREQEIVYLPGEDLKSQRVFIAVDDFEVG
ncbi:hypothetical protein ABQE22_10825 [Enterococcus durans]|uniref:hypothetical protein n=1 Tax=Enterococcus durans TaxID=53345 RepID=UPI00232C73D1|nr:hypothetical protein [Enterococcus durans]MDB1653535.1 hypothetical protein [Enterococcus durans]MDB1655040.1 hypothetical protein [Enterococcus durans]MDB1664596.1 hypothetical protein [Enterococcus durans]MDB1668651.1 hypothetical protein [Enterococcus durans]MDB1671645.1 hypothetical protein [Enterococcus durans]